MAHGDPIRSYIDARHLVDTLEAQLDTAKKARDDRERDVLSLFEKEGMQRVRLDGKTVYLERKLHASAKAGRQPDIVSALHQIGHDDLVTETYNASRLSAWVRELDEAGTPVPSPLADLLNVGEVFRVKVRAR